MEQQNQSNLVPEALLPLRAEIDAIDHKIVDLLQQRNTIVERVAAVKKVTGFGIRDFKREKELLTDRGELAQSVGLRSEVIESLFRVILWASRDRQAALGVAIPKQIEHKTIAIIGGNGEMGQLFAKLFEGFGHTIVIADLHTSCSNIEAVKEAEVVLITVPIDNTIEVIKEIGPHCKEDALLVDITSTKQEPIQAMLDTFKGSVIGTHPLFGPNVHSLQGQRIAVISARDTANWHDWLSTIFLARGLSVLDTTAEEHDHAMSIVQVLTHQTTEVLGRTIQKLNVDVRKTLEFTSPIYLMELLMAARHFAQSANLYASIQMNNPQTETVLSALKIAGDELREIVLNKDTEAFRELFSEVHEHFGDFSEQALEQSSFLIDRLVERV
ncbi:MAG: bifunctional chorismate mutase/prephenate dehydrogenase [Phycisphaerae bacterium]|nr:bifunctional chorismate mutase/prephenate dehydrogenase [Phycisphaerae bacterium]MBT5364970.1 bifunctional chorismate mutase/prephenate dehydrogenase [Phycisphaerae bacterium]MBT6269308.1 bifunctional chorismate mutase/prephenate dehydrogenase [Phycisphaerae bacterium]MBT6283535.1 bifunctional chorismate mutase/prephenate dehydrogenase [Phycisphaerae bacterium]